jgi:hypothetical protein
VSTPARAGKRAHRTLTTRPDPRTANIDWMHRPTHHGTPAESVLDDAPRQARIHWNRVSIPVPGLGIGRYGRAKRNVPTIGAARCLHHFAVLIGVLGILAGIVTWRKQCERTLCCACVPANARDLRLRTLRLVRSARNPPIPRGHWQLLNGRPGRQRRVDDRQPRTPLEIRY